MLFSVSIIILGGLIFGWVAKKAHLPYIIGMLAFGILIGPYGLNLLDDSILAISSDIRRIALMIIIVKAGLSLNIKDLKRIGRPAILLCFLPATFEIIGFLLFAPSLMNVTRIQAGILGAVMGAVSPAVTVPRLTRYIDEGYGTKKGIPQMLIAGASADDVYVIVLFTALVSMEAGGAVNWTTLLEVPESIILGILLGLFAGFLMFLYLKRFDMQMTLKVLIVIGVAMMLYAAEDSLEGTIAISGLLAVMTMGMVLNYKLPELAKQLTVRFTKIWTGAEIFLFVLVGACVNIHYVKDAGLGMIIMLFVGLVFREIGAYLSILHTGLNKKEELFCLVSELPKATVQAAIGGIPLSMGLACGETVLTMAVISIVITAPIGAFAMDSLYQKCLSRDV